MATDREIIGIEGVPTSTPIASPVAPLLGLGRFAIRKPLGFIGLLVILVVVVVAALPDLIAPYDPQETRVLQRLTSPNGTYIMGTDGLGRDVFSRIVYGARFSVQISLYSVLLGTTL